MVMLSLMLAMVYGPWQLWVLASPTRTVGFGLVLRALIAGMVIALPVAVAIEWTWTRLARQWVDRSTNELVTWAGWTVDPFIEEIVRLLPLLILFRFVARCRLEWSMTDVVVVSTAVGSGFRLGEHLARIGDRVGFAGGLTSNDGWIVGLSAFAPATVDYPWVVVRRWMPPGVGVDSPLPAQGLDHNLIAIWSTLGGLAFALWVLVPLRFDSVVRRRASRWSAVGLVFFAGLAHASVNATSAFAEWPWSILSIVRPVEQVYWAWPLLALAAAMAIDVVVLRRSQQPTTSAGEAGPDSPVTGPSWQDLAVLALQRPLISVPAVWSFLSIQRNHRYSVQSMTPNAAPTDEFANNARALHDQQLFELVGAIAAAFDEQHRRGRDLWSEALQQRRRLRRERRLALSRSPIVIGYLMIAVLLLVAPTIYLVIGGTARFVTAQQWLLQGDGSWLTVASGFGGIGFGIAILGLAGRAWRRTPPVLSEGRSRLALTIAIQACTVLSLAVSLGLLWTGTDFDQPIVNNLLHGLDALAALLLGAGIAILVGVAAVVAFPVIATAAGVTVTTGGLLAAAGASGTLIAGGVALSNSSPTVSTPSFAPHGRPSLDDFLQTPLEPPGNDFLVPVSLGALMLALAAGREILDNMGDSTLPAQPLDPRQYIDGNGDVRWRDSNQLVSDIPNRSQYRDNQGVWRWSDTGVAVESLESEPDTEDAASTSPTTIAPSQRPRTAKDELTEAGLSRPVPLLDAELVRVENWARARNDFLDRWHATDLSGVSSEVRRLLEQGKLNLERQMTPDDLAGIMKEGRGVDVPGGDHLVNEWPEQRNALTNALTSIRKAIGDTRTTPHEVEMLQRRMRELSRLTDTYEAYVVYAEGGRTP